MPYKNTVRIIGGHYRSRLLHFPNAKDLRPTSDRTRERIFNWLGDLTNCCCLDLFAGSGALGFEAASRGAKKVVMIEQNARIAQSLLDNKNRLEAHQVDILVCDATIYLKHSSELFDLVFLDPPFTENRLPALLNDMDQYLTPRGLVYIESARLPKLSEPWHFFKQGKSQCTEYALLRTCNS